jgi:hypothetical protein
MYQNWRVTDDIGLLRGLAHDKIHVARRNGWTLDEMAKITGVSRTTLWRMSSYLDYKAKVENVLSVLEADLPYQMRFPGF